MSLSSTATRPPLRVAALHCYPIKGCAPVAVTRGELTRAGLRHDRAFMVVGDDGTCRTQRAHPRLASIHPEITADGTRLVLRSAGLGEIDVLVDTAGERRAVGLFGATYGGIDQGGEVAGWLSETLGVPSRLVRVPPEHDRVTDGLTPGTSGYADSCPIHILSDTSLEALNRTLCARGAVPLPMNRFRPNIVVTGACEPHVEDALRRVRIGEAVLGYAKPAIRCAVPTVDQSSGVRSGPEPLTTLAAYRRAPDGGVAFGAKFAVTVAGRISVGDVVVVQERGDVEVRTPLPMRP